MRWSKLWMPELTFGEVALVDRFKQIAAVEIRIGAVELDRLVPDHGGGADGRAPVKLDEGGLAFGVDQPESVDAEALHHAIASAGWRGPTSPR